MDGMKFRGVRGATTADANTPEAILRATRELLQQMIEVNSIQEEDVASILFSTTPDLNAAYPAKAARELGWTQVPLMGFQEIDVPGGLDRCIRILIHWNTTRRQDEIRHIFSKGATCLRPDLAQKLPNSL